MWLEDIGGGRVAAAVAVSMRSEERRGIAEGFFGDEGKESSVRNSHGTDDAYFMSSGKNKGG